MAEIHYVYASEEWIGSYAQAARSVAKERKHLASTEGFPEESTRRFVQHILTNRLAQFYALEGARVVGWCDILPRPYEGMDHVGILGMGVLKAYRGRGIGNALFKLTMKHAKEINGIEKVELEVFQTNTAAIAFYEKAEFRREGVRIRARKIDGVCDDLLLMGREI